MDSNNIINNIDSNSNDSEDNNNQGLLSEFKQPMKSKLALISFTEELDLLLKNFDYKNPKILKSKIYI